MKREWKVSSSQRWYNEISEEISEAIEDTEDDRDCVGNQSIIDIRIAELKQCQKELDETSEIKLMGDDFYFGIIQDKVQEISKKPYKMEELKKECRSY